MQIIRIALITFLAACSTSTAWAQYGLYGAPAPLRLPPPDAGLANAAPISYPMTATPASQPTGVPTMENGQPTEPLLLCRPELVQSSQIPEIQSPEPNQTDRALPINLATALCLSQARPLVISAAQTSVAKAAAQLQGANALWLPDLHLGVDYSHHDGANQETNGNVDFASFGSLYSGGGATLSFGVTDAIFTPLAAQQELRARQFDVQTACNAALLSEHGRYHPGVLC
jgi:hypothetical protein